MVEFLVKAQGNQWMENLAKESWLSKKLTQEMYNARGEKGDIVEVRKDKSVYGNLECLPSFVIIKVPEIKNFEEIKYALEGAVWDKVFNETTNAYEEILIKKRKTFVLSSLVDLAVENNGELTITKIDFIGYLQKRSINDDKNLISSAAEVKDIDG